MRGDFVIQLRSGGDLNRETLQGRIEHVDSGRSARFQSVEELVSFVLRTLHQEAGAAGELLSSRTLLAKDLTKS